MKVDLPYYNMCTSPSNISVDLSLLNSEKQSELAFWSGKLELTLRQSCTAVPRQMEEQFSWLVTDLVRGRGAACRGSAHSPVAASDSFQLLLSHQQWGEKRWMPGPSKVIRNWRSPLTQSPHLGQHFPRYSGSLTIRVFSATSRHQLLKSNSGLMARYSDRGIPDVSISEILAESPWLSNYSCRSLRSRIYCAQACHQAGLWTPYVRWHRSPNFETTPLTLNWVMSNFVHVDDLMLQGHGRLRLSDSLPHFTFMCLAVLST